MRTDTQRRCFEIVKQNSVASCKASQVVPSVRDIRWATGADSAEAVLGEGATLTFVSQSVPDTVLAVGSRNSLFLDREFPFTCHARRAVLLVLAGPAAEYLCFRH
ncbi:hypothetical protein BaRGS_00003419 [Batillaria attramentaria]|uniref:Uncharacterized protein n=1 Tax=Batillaria attramentaria TaxID=370345 RepID=A0ABD0M229_9CAEN